MLNDKRPPVFCPGCSHERVLHGLDQALVAQGLSAEQVGIVSDIGCSGLFDTFFNTHAFHGLHGRALTYATGIKMARPELTVIVTMGDGGLGIGGAHVLSACRRNLDLTLLVLNNFNYGMTGGQCSATTPNEAIVGSAFLNRLELPLDICQVAGAAGAAYLERLSTYDDNLVERLQQAIGFDGFSVVDIWGICTGRYTKRNRITPKSIAALMDQAPSLESWTARNQRQEYGRHYRQEAGQQKAVAPPAAIEARHVAPGKGRQEVVILGSAGQRIITAGEILCLAGATAGLQATQKIDYPITVMRGHSVSEMILSDNPIGYTGIEQPTVVIALAQEGIERRRSLLAALTPTARVYAVQGVRLPECAAQVMEMDFKALKIRSQDWALAALGWLAADDVAISAAMLRSALTLRFQGTVCETALSLVEKVFINQMGS